MRGVALALKSALACGLLASAVATACADVLPPPRADWTLTLGVEGRVLPSFDGSDRYILRPFPIIELRRAGTPRNFSAPRDGISFAIWDVGVFKAGPTFKIRMPRDEGDDVRLRGLGDVSWAFEAGGFVEYWPLAWLRGRAEVRQGFGGHHGVVSDLTADVVVPLGPQFTFSAGPRVTFASGPANSPYFSVNAVQSALSGLPVYSAGGGLYSTGAGAQLRYEWSRAWAARLWVEYERLRGDAGNSPIVLQRGSRNQFTTGLGVSYAFDIPGLF